MVDIRFHAAAAPATLSALLKAAGFTASIDELRSHSLSIEGAHELDLAGPEHLALAVGKDYRPSLEATAAGAVVVTPALRDAVPVGTIAVVSERAHELFVELLNLLYPQDTRAVFAAVGLGGAELFVEDDVVIGPNVVIGPGVEIGSGTIIGANTVIGAGVAIGRDWLDHGRSNRKIPQLGRVILQDGVEIGANTTIDRGALGDTVIGEGTKVDNLVQIGHNCRIGRNCLIAALAGLSGSTIVEDSVMFGGGAATAGHLRIGRGSVIYAWGGVTKDVPPGSRFAGFPAEDVRAWRRGVAKLRGLTNRGEN
jgi:UDP-3-O-[3-hydroxymyristoyl] glucosamine N-acyltransferase